MSVRSHPWAVVLCVLLAATAGAAALGTEFTYQGVLTDGGSPASGSYDFRFLLYNADVGGSQVGGIVYVDDLGVSDGRVVAQLDFGSVFDGTALWLEVGVRDGASTGSYSVLSPRQELTAGPYAQHAVHAHSATTADSATTAGDALKLDGQDSDYYLQWDNLTGVPGDLTDGDDDTVGALDCGDDEIAKWTGSAWACSSDEGLTYARTHVVGPVGSATENGTALIAAMTALATPVSQAEARLVRVEPGLYDLGSGSLAMKPWVDLEGSGRDVTVITSAICGEQDTGTVVGAADAELRMLTVYNTCGSQSDYGIAVYNTGDGFRLSRVDLWTTGTEADTYGVLNTGPNVVMTDLNVTVGGRLACGVAAWGNYGSLTAASITASGSEGSTGVEGSADNLLLTEITSMASGGSNDNWCFALSGAWITLRDAIAYSASGASRVGVYVRSGSSASVILEEVNAVAERALSLASGSDPLTVILRDVRASGSTYGLYADEGTAALTVSCDGSRLYGGTDGVHNVDADVTIAVSMLQGGAYGAVTCLGVHDGSGTFNTTGCP